MTLEPLAQPFVLADEGDGEALARQFDVLDDALEDLLVVAATLESPPLRFRHEADHLQRRVVGKVLDPLADEIGAGDPVHLDEPLAQVAKGLR
jgi:hypothetical protein